MAADPDIARCRAQLHAGSKSFAAASRLLPRSLRDDATVLYAFCREADDLVDTQQGHPAAIAALRERVERIEAGRPLDRPCDRAMAGLVARHHLPRLPLDALIEGFEWDVQGRRYETLEALEAYAARVAGTVGAMMAVLMGTRTPSAIARACELGLAMQLSNIARDVGEDARAGRLYLPAAWLREAGIDPDAWLARPVHSAALGGVVQRLLAAADRLYAGIEPGIAQLPAGCRPGIRAAQRVYAEIGSEIARAGHDSVTQRAVVPARRKLQLLARALLPVATARAISPPQPARASIRFLVESVAQGGERLPLAVDPRGATIPWWQFRARALWLIDLFARLETERRAAPRGLGLGGH